jgi:hypothetical protein
VATARRWRRPERFYDLLAPLARLLVGLLADLRVVGAERIPARGGGPAGRQPRLPPRPGGARGRPVRLRPPQGPLLALADLFDNPLVGWLLRGTRMIPVARGRGAARMAEDACAALDAGQAVLVYPEGTIVPPGQTRPARPGAALGGIVLQLGGAKTCLSGNRPRPLHYWTSCRAAGSRPVRRGQ